MPQRMSAPGWLPPVGDEAGHAVQPRGALDGADHGGAADRGRSTRTPAGCEMRSPTKSIPCWSAWPSRSTRSRSPMGRSSDAPAARDDHGEAGVAVDRELAAGRARGAADDARVDARGELHRRPDPAGEVVEAVHAHGDDGVAVGADHRGAQPLAGERPARHAPLGHGLGHHDARRHGHREGAGLVGAAAAAGAADGAVEEGLDLLPQLADGAVPHRRIGAERAGDLAVEGGGEVGPVAQLPRDGGVDARQRRALAGEHARDDAQLAVAVAQREGLGAAEHLVEDGGEREDVGLRAHPVVAHLVLLGRRVAEAGAGDGDGLVGGEVRQLDQAEVGDLDDLHARPAARA